MISEPEFKSKDLLPFLLFFRYSPIILNIQNIDKNVYLYSYLLFHSICIRKKCGGQKILCPPQIKIVGDMSPTVATPLALG